MIPAHKSHDGSRISATADLPSWFLPSHSILSTSSLLDPNLGDPIGRPPNCGSSVLSRHWLQDLSVWDAGLYVSFPKQTAISLGTSG